jgi:6-phospho-beta-glucosidase
MKRQRVVVWGGSGLATPEFVSQLMLQAPAESAWEVVLWGRNEGKLRLVERVSRRLAGDGPADVLIKATTDLAEANSGADWVINQVRAGGLQERTLDETLPLCFNLFGEETIGAGGFRNAMRTIPVVLDLCRRLQEAAPRATILNLANPSSLVQYAIRRTTGLAVIGVCDSPIVLMQRVAALLHLPYEEMQFSTAGMHHFSWILAVRHAGKDYLPEVLRRCEEIPSLEIDPRLIRALGALPSPYFKYLFHPERMLARAKGRPPRAEELLTLNDTMEKELSRWNGGPLPPSLAQRGAVWYRLIVVPALLALAGWKPGRCLVSGDNGALIPWLPEDAIVELPAVIAGPKVMMEPPAAIPAAVKALWQQNNAYEQGAVAAIVERSYDQALMTLLLNRAFSNYDQARSFLDIVWEK